MLDFVIPDMRIYQNKAPVLTPDFKHSDSIKDLMVRGREFYAIWDYENECWSTSLERAYMLIDKCMMDYLEQEKERGAPLGTSGLIIKKASVFGDGVSNRFLQYMKQKGNSFVPLNTRVVFRSDPPD